MAWILRSLLCIAAALFLSALVQIHGNAEEKRTDSKLVIAVSIVPEKTFVEAVAGKHAKVLVMIPPGYSPGNYEPKPKEMEEFGKAKIYFAIGIPAEKSNILPKAKNMKIIMLHNETAKIYPDREFSPGKRDPHIWLSPKRAKVMVEIISRELCSFDPGNKNDYIKNTKQYSQELDKLDNEIQKTVKGVINRKFIVFHPAFGYFAEDYKLTMYALEQDGKEASPVRLKEMIDFAKKENIKAIFYQAEISSRQAQSFADEIGGKTVKLAPLSPDYTENLKKIAGIFNQVMR